MERAGCSILYIDFMKEVTFLDKKSLVNAAQNKDSSFSTTTIKEDITPFNLKYLSENLGLDLENVDKDKFDAGDYCIYFKTKESGRQFAKALQNIGCSANFWRSNRSVKLSSSYENKQFLINHDNSNFLAAKLEREKNQALLEEKRRRDFAARTTKIVPNHIDLAMEATNPNDYLKNLIAAFFETYADAKSVEREQWEYRNSKDRPIGVVINNRPVCLRAFESRVKQLEAPAKLHSLFLDVNDWQKLYKDLEPITKEQIDRFVYFVNSVAKSPNSYDVIFNSAVEAHTYYITQNPYAK